MLDRAIDSLIYRPFMVKLLLTSPVWWHCQLATLSRRLDERWSTRYWADRQSVPSGLCDACGRRAAWIEYDFPGFPRPTIALCGWCRLLEPTRTPAELEIALRSARESSIGWRWRETPG